MDAVCVVLLITLYASTEALIWALERQRKPS